MKKGNNFYCGINNQKNHTYNNENSKNNNSGTISDDDLYSLNLLSKVLIAQRISVVASVIGEIATVEAITRVYNKYRDIEIQTLDPNDLAVYSLYLSILSGVIRLKLSLMQYRNLCEQYRKGDIDYSLRPNVDINIANFLGILANSYGLFGALGVRERESQGPLV